MCSSVFQAYLIFFLKNMTLDKDRNWRILYNIYKLLTDCYDSFLFSNISKILSEIIILCANPKSTSHGEDNTTSNAKSRFLSSLQEFQEEYSQKLDLQEHDLPCLGLSRQNRREELF